MRILLNALLQLFVNVREDEVKFNMYRDLPGLSTITPHLPGF